MNKLREAARQVVANGVQGTYAKYYSVPPADFEALREALAEQVEQEPVGVVNPNGNINWRVGQEQLPPRTKLYAAPVRTKVLTPHEITDLIREGAADGGWQGFAQCVIAAFKEKNK